MNAVVAGLLGALGTAALKMLTALITEAFIKKAVVIALEKLVVRTASDADDRLLREAKKAWFPQSGETPEEKPAE